MPAGTVTSSPWTCSPRGSDGAASATPSGTPMPVNEWPLPVALTRSPSRAAAFTAAATPSTSWATTRRTGSRALVPGPVQQVPGHPASITVSDDPVADAAVGSPAVPSRSRRRSTVTYQSPASAIPPSTT